MRWSIRVEKAGIIHAGVGKASFTEEALLQNIKALADAVQKSKPAGAKGTYMKRVAVSSTMGPGVHVDPSSVHCLGLITRFPAASSAAGDAVSQGWQKSCPRLRVRRKGA